MTRKENLIGRTFGLWLVIDSAPNFGGRTAWLCECQCKKKTKKVIKAYILKVGDTQSCGCKERVSHNFNDISGQTFGELTVIKRLPNSKHKKALYLCRCSCENKTEIITSASDLRRGHTISCGCERERKLIESNLKHGQAKTRLYKIWGGMKKRCYTPSETYYKHYGGRGITMCEEWKESFEVFAEWAKENGYNDTLTIERNNVNGNYEPSNCCWIPLGKQSRNTRKTAWVTYKGTTKTAIDWAEELGLHPGTVRNWRLKGIIDEKFEWIMKMNEGN